MLTLEQLNAAYTTKAITPRESVMCRLHGRRFEVFRSSSGKSLWRWATLEDQQKDNTLSAGQNIVAFGPAASIEFLQSYCFDHEGSTVKDRWLRTLMGVDVHVPGGVN